MFHGVAFDKRVNTGPRCHSDFDSQKDRWWLLVRRQLYVYLFLFLEHCVKCIHLFLWIILFQFRSLDASPGLTLRSTFCFLRCFHGSNGRCECVLLFKSLFPCVCVVWSRELYQELFPIINVFFGRPWLFVNCSFLVIFPTVVV